jgi:hypothetical protein
MESVQVEESTVNEANADMALRDLERKGSEINWLSDADDATKKIWKKAGVNPENAVILYSYASHQWDDAKKILKKYNVDFKELEDPNSEGESFIVFVKESTEVNEANWGTYSTPEGKQADKKLDKAFAKFKAAVSKAHATYRDEIKSLSNSDLGNKSGFNDSEGGMAVADYLQHFVKSEFMMGDFSNISRFDYMKGMYEGMTWDGLKESLGLNERSINKISKEHAATVLDMSKTVEEWKAADGDRKAELLDKLKALTQKKKDLEKELDSAVAGKDKDLELAISETEKKTLDEGLESDIKKFIKNHRSELEDMADNDQWEDIHDMLYTEFDVQKDSRKAKDLIQTFEFMF